MAMIERTSGPVTLAGGVPSPLPAKSPAGREKTLSYRILRAHDRRGTHGEDMRISFDALISHDITYVGIIQTARASGMKEFPIPYALTNCHNSLCAVGGTINEDDHQFLITLTLLQERYQLRLSHLILQQPLQHRMYHGHYYIRHHNEQLNFLLFHLQQLLCYLLYGYKQIYCLLYLFHHYR